MTPSWKTPPSLFTLGQCFYPQRYWNDLKCHDISFFQRIKPFFGWKWLVGCHNNVLTSLVYFSFMWQGCICWPCLLPFFGSDGGEVHHALARNVTVWRSFLAVPSQSSSVFSRFSNDLSLLFLTRVGDRPSGSTTVVSRVRACSPAHPRLNINRNKQANSGA